jgi:hypothetical protein
MSVTHTWSIERLEQLNNETGTVANIFFKVYSVDGDVNCTSSGMVDLNTENIEEFIDYEDLTEELLLEWVKERLGENLGNFEINNAAWIDSVLNPPAPRVITKPLPWIPSEEPVVEEPVVEETTTEEPVVEETTTEEPVVEEPVVEETTTEEPVVE